MQLTKGSKSADGLPGTNAADRYPALAQYRIDQPVPIPAILSITRPIVQLNHHKRPSGGVDDHEITDLDVTLFNAV